MRYCNILEFIAHIKRWREIPNPAHVLELGAPVQYMGTIAWTHIIKRMRESNIDPHKLDMTQYIILQNLTANSVLTAALLEMKKAIEDGTYNERWKAYEKIQHRELFDWQMRIMQNKKIEQGVTGLNNKRFSHKFPKGVAVDNPLSDPSLQAFLDAKKVERARAEEQAAKEAAAAGSPLFPKPDEPKPPKKWYTVVFVSPVKSLKNGVGWAYILFCLIVFAPLIGGFMRGNMTGSLKFTEAD
jgi:hypothetical protein